MTVFASSKMMTSEERQHSSAAPPFCVHHFCAKEPITAVMSVLASLWKMPSVSKASGSEVKGL